MPSINRGHLSDLRGAVDLAVDATIGITNLVEEMHHAIQLKHTLSVLRERVLQVV